MARLTLQVSLPQAGSPINLATRASSTVWAEYAWGLSLIELQLVRGRVGSSSPTPLESAIL